MRRISLATVHRERMRWLKSCAERGLRVYEAHAQPLAPHRTANGPVSPGEQRASGPAPQPTFDQRNRRVSWGCGEPTFAASLPDGVVAPVLGAARASAHADNPGRSVPSRKWEMGGKHR